MGGQWGRWKQGGWGGEQEGGRGKLGGGGKLEDAIDFVIGEVVIDLH